MWHVGITGSSYIRVQNIHIGKNKSWEGMPQVQKELR